MKERGELDVVLPDLLSEFRMHVYSRPGLGTRQDGVDVAAVGALDRGGNKKVHLLSIKGGDLDRRTWQGGSPQSLRWSLDQILDAYIPQSIPPEYRGLPIVIWICVGGEIKESVRRDVSGYCEKQKTKDIEFQEWDGDRLSDLFLRGLMSDKFLSDEHRSVFRKAVALVDEPATAARHFRRLITSLTHDHAEKPREKLRTLRLINLLLRILIGWGRSARNYEAPYLGSEAALLVAWQLANSHLRKSSKTSRDIAFALNLLVQSYLVVSEEYIKGKIIPHVDKYHGLSMAVSSSKSLDVNLKLFETLGRLALLALWVEQFLAQVPQDDTARREELLVEIAEYRRCLKSLIEHNPVLVSPIAESQTTAISLALMVFSTDRSYHSFARHWVGQLLACSRYQYMMHLQYPCIHTEYRLLARHPSRRDDDYRKSATAGSVLYPTLALWTACFGGTELFDEIASFASAQLAHCTLQMWLPDESSEPNLYLGPDGHGAAVTGIPLQEGSVVFLDLVVKECRLSDGLFKLSAMQFGYWAIVLTACRHYQLPVPPHFVRDRFGLNQPS